MVQKMLGYNCAKGLGQTLPYSASNRFKVTSKFLEKKIKKNITHSSSAANGPRSTIRPRSSRHTRAAAFEPGKRDPGVSERERDGVASR